MVLGIALTAARAPAQPARGGDPDWPCKQIKVPTIALAQYWPGAPLDPAQISGRSDAQIAELAARLAARRTTMEEAGKLIAAFAGGAGAQRKEKLELLALATFERLSAERSEVVSGLERFGGKLRAMADRLRAEGDNLRAAQDASPQDAAKVRDLTEKIQWDVRVFDERKQALTYVCETPQLIEQRLGAIERLIAAAMS
ncbi:MAG: hypothetical protein KGL46_01150 [Hyphomicrobiales bacterium]|nr:hypothetical protein [Hyphomicrobiales bacterium]